MAFYTKHKRVLLVIVGGMLVLGIEWQFALRPGESSVTRHTETTDVSRPEWEEYVNTEYGFAIGYPTAGNVYPHEEYLTPGNWPDFLSISFRASPDDMVGFGVQVYPKGFTSAEEWFAKHQEMTGPMSEYVIEQRRAIAGEEAIVTYWRETPENEQPYEYRERQAAFMHNGVLYVIGIRALSVEDSEKIWSSFRFLDSPGVGDTRAGDRP